MKESKPDNTNKEFRDTRARWAREQTALFLNILEKVGKETGVTIKPIQYVRAYKLCVEDLKFAYPAEYKVTEIISTDETIDQTLEMMTAVMKVFRQDFQKRLKNHNSSNRRHAA